MEYWFEKSQVGQDTLASIRHGAPIPAISKKDLMGLIIWLPSKSEQALILEGVSHIKNIKAEVDEREKELWDGSKTASSTLERISLINKEDSYEEWIDSLPFPLASILWRHHAFNGSSKDKYEILLHFFEATTAFLATVHLSAFMQSKDLWSEYLPILKRGLAKEHLSFERASFGSWRFAFEFLSKKCSKLLGKPDSEETLKHLYGTTNRTSIETLCHPELRILFQESNKVRNQESAHAGAISDEHADDILSRMEILVQRLRGVFGRQWNHYELIRPGAAKFKSGIHQVDAERIMGTRHDPFASDMYESTFPLETNELYLFDRYSQMGLKMYPFVKVAPSPKRKAMTCFFYSRHGVDQSQFVSYHYSQESEISEVVPEIDEMLNLLSHSEEA